MGLSAPNIAENATPNSGSGAHLVILLNSTGAAILLVISGTLGGRRITAPAPSGEVRLFSVLFSSPSPNVRQNPNSSQNNTAESCRKRPPDLGNSHVTTNRCHVAFVKITKGCARFPQSISADHLRHMRPPFV
jgi:hypothetical protein